MNTPPNDTDAWGLTPTFQGCRQKEIDAINKTLKEDCKKAEECGKKCRSEEGKKAAATGIDKVCNQNPTMVETPRGNLVAGMKWFLGTYRF